MAIILKERNGKTTPFGLHGALHVDGRNLVDEHGNITQLRGLSTHNVCLYSEYVNESAFKEFADNFGVSIMRIAMYTAEADDVKGYSDSDDTRRLELEDLVERAVRYCAELGIYCLVDWHILFDYNPLMNKEMAIHFFKNMTAKLKEYDNVIYEICNEPNMNTETEDAATWQDITDYANEIIPIIREIDPNKVIIVGTPIWSQRVDKAADAPLSFENIMYTLHFYADTHKEELRKKLDYALSKNLPVFVTEFGICDASGNGAVNDEETNIWLNKLIKENISYVMWNISNKEETSAIFKPTCDKSFGFTDDDLSAAGAYINKIMTM